MEFLLLPHLQFHLQKTLETVLGTLLEHVKNTTDEMPHPEELIRDFMLTRLPPFGVDRAAISEETPEGRAPSLSDSVRLLHPSHTTFLVADSEDEDSEGEPYCTTLAQRS